MFAVGDMREILSIDPDSACQIYAMLVIYGRIDGPQGLENLQALVFRSWLQSADSKRIYETWIYLVEAARYNHKSILSLKYIR